MRLREAGDGSGEKAFEEVLEKDLQRAERLSLPITLLVLLIAFGALVAASVPLLLGVTSVAAAMGAFGVVSHLVPDGGSTGPLVVLIGLAVGVDYSLFYIRREREERRAGRGPDAALEAAAATVGRAIVVSGLTVMVSIGRPADHRPARSSPRWPWAAILVVAIAVLGSLTVLPAVLALLGDRIDRGRLPGLGRPRVRRGVWGAVAGAATRRPVAVAHHRRVADGRARGARARPEDRRRRRAPACRPTCRSRRPSARSSAPSPARPRRPSWWSPGRRLDRAGAGGARRSARWRSPAAAARSAWSVSRDGQTALVSVPMPERGLDDAAHTVDRLRDEVDADGGAHGPAPRRC